MSNFAHLFSAVSQNYVIFPPKILQSPVPAKSLDSHKNLVFLPKQAFLEMSTPVISELDDWQPRSQGLSSSCPVELSSFLADWETRKREGR